MEPVIREFGGESVTFTKAQQSHLEGTECVYLGRANGRVYLYDSNDPDTVMSTSERHWQVFADAHAQGEFAASS